MGVTRTETGDWSVREVRSLFAALSAPTLVDLVGRWDGQLVGTPALRMTSLGVAAVTPLRGWCGKQVDHDGRVVNLVQRHGRVVAATEGRASEGRSLLDGRPAIVVDYSMTASPPVRWLRGELRWLSPDDRILGVLLLATATRPLGPPLPFVLSAQPGDAAA